MDWLATVYDSSAQYGSPPVKEICKSIDGFPKGTDILTRISAGSAFYYNYELEGTSSTTNNTCLDIQQYPNEGWSWQVQNLFFLINIKQAEVMKWSCEKRLIVRSSWDCLGIKAPCLNL